MGRKFNALEELQASLADSNADHSGDPAQPRQQHLARIADTLGITTRELRGHPTPQNAIKPATDPVRQKEFLLAQQCRDLVEAFVQIQDPQDRLRCLHMVRAATQSE